MAFVVAKALATARGTIQASNGRIFLYSLEYARQWHFGVQRSTPQPTGRVVLFDSNGDQFPFLATDMTHALAMVEEAVNVSASPE